MASVVQFASAVQFYVPKWDDKARFAKDFAICEGIYGRSVNELDIDRAYARYTKLAVEKEEN